MEKNSSNIMKETNSSNMKKIVSAEWFGGEILPDVNQS